MTYYINDPELGKIYLIEDTDTKDLADAKKSSADDKVETINEISVDKNE